MIVAGATVQLYRSAGQPSRSWAATIPAFPASVLRGSSYAISGTQFNGLSQAAHLEMRSRLRQIMAFTNQSPGQVFYARPHDHSAMAVATGSAVVSTNFDVPSATETGASSLEIIANGITSPSVRRTVN